MSCDAFRLQKSVVTAANSFQVPTPQVRAWARNACVQVSQWVVETMAMWQDKGGLITRRMDNDVRECTWEIPKVKTIINKHGASPEQ
jgi:hypothetical protein